MENKFIKCQCQMHALELNHDEEDECVYIAIWNYGDLGSERNLWARIKIGLRYIFKNELYGDHVILGKEEALELNEFVQNKLGK